MRSYCWGWGYCCGAVGEFVKATGSFVQLQFKVKYVGEIVEASRIQGVKLSGGFEGW